MAHLPLVLGVWLPHYQLWRSLLLLPQQSVSSVRCCGVTWWGSRGWLTCRWCSVRDCCSTSCGAACLPVSPAERVLGAARGRL